MDGKILWKISPGRIPTSFRSMCCDTVNRGVAYADADVLPHQAMTLVALMSKTGESLVGDGWREAGKGQSGTDAPFRLQGQGAGRRFRRRIGVRGWVSAYNIKDGKLAGRGYSGNQPDFDTLILPSIRPHSASRSDGFLDFHLAGRSMEDRRRRHLGLVFL